MSKLSNRKLNNLKSSKAVKSMVAAGYDKRKAIKIILKTIKKLVDSDIHPNQSMVNLNNLFVWEYTEQGHDFWANIHYKKYLK